MDFVPKYTCVIGLSSKPTHYFKIIHQTTFLNWNENKNLVDKWFCGLEKCPRFGRVNKLVWTILVWFWQWQIQVMRQQCNKISPGRSLVRCLWTYIVDLRWLRWFHDYDAAFLVFSADINTVCAIHFINTIACLFSYLGLCESDCWNWLKLCFFLYMM